MPEPVHIRIVLDGIVRDRRPMQGPRRLCEGCKREPAASLDSEFCDDCHDAMDRGFSDDE